jgi:hypothetical protein
MSTESQEMKHQARDVRFAGARIPFAALHITEAEGYATVCVKPAGPLAEAVFLGQTGELGWSHGQRRYYANECVVSSVRHGETQFVVTSDGMIETTPLDPRRSPSGRLARASRPLPGPDQLGTAENARRASAFGQSRLARRHSSLSMNGLRPHRFFSDSQPPFRRSLRGPIWYRLTTKKPSNH